MIFMGHTGTDCGTNATCVGYKILSTDGKTWSQTRGIPTLDGTDPGGTEFTDPSTGRREVCVVTGDWTLPISCTLTENLENSSSWSTAVNLAPQDSNNWDYAPDLFTLDNGDILLTYGHDKGSDFSLMQMRSTNGGQTWSAPTAIYDSSRDDSYPRLAQLSDGTIVMTFLKRDAGSFTYQTNSGVFAIRSTDEGYTWTGANPPSLDPVITVYDNSSSKDYWGSIITVNNDGNEELWTAFTTNEDQGSEYCPSDDAGCGDIKMVRSTDSGLTWTDKTIISETSDDENWPTLAQLNDGTVLAVWNDLNSTTGQSNGFYESHKYPNMISRASTDSSGNQSNADSGGQHEVAVSADGRYTAFKSYASNLVPNDTNGSADIFMKDRDTDTTTRISTDSSGNEANAGSYELSMTPDGRYVAFDSAASNLVAGDTNGAVDIFVKDTQTGTTTIVSTNSSGVQGNSDSWAPSISSDGRYVAFVSDATNLVSGDSNNNWDVFVKDIQTGQIERESVSSSGAQANGSSLNFVAISGDGTKVAFTSDATNLVPGDTNNVSDVFVRDRTFGTTTRVSVNSSGTQGNGASYDPAISYDGHYVSFTSEATNFVPGTLSLIYDGDTNGFKDIFLRDTSANTTKRVSTTFYGGQATGGNSYESSISSDGRYVSFGSDATNLVSGDTNNVSDVFVKDTQGPITRASVDRNGAQGNAGSGEASISSNGSFIGFRSAASNLVPNDTNGFWDIFNHRVE